MSHIYRPFKKTEKKSDPELQKLKKDLYDYEKTIFRIDDTVHSGGKSYEKLVLLANDLDKTFNNLKEYLLFKELPDVIQIEKTLEDIDYERRKICPENHEEFISGNHGLDWEGIEYAFSAFFGGVVGTPVGSAILYANLKAGIPLEKSLWTPLGVYLLLAPISLPLTIKTIYKMMDLPERISVYRNNRLVNKFFKNRDKKMKNYSKRLVKHSKLMIKQIKKKVLKER